MWTCTLKTVKRFNASCPTIAQRFIFDSFSFHVCFVFVLLLCDKNSSAKPVPLNNCSMKTEYERFIDAYCILCKVSELLLWRLTLVTLNANTSPIWDLGPQVHVLYFSVKTLSDQILPFHNLLHHPRKKYSTSVDCFVCISALNVIGSMYMFIIICWR